MRSTTLHDLTQLLSLSAVGFDNQTCFHYLEFKDHPDLMSASLALNDGVPKSKAEDMHYTLSGCHMIGCLFVGNFYGLSQRISAC
jgi:hypothetical protein